jgi:CO/xanthine dehydrogenase Mo-binding subunit
VTREDPQFVEPERYELSARLPYRFAVGRRGFLQLVGGIVVLVTAARGRAQESGRSADERDEAPPELSAWLHIGEDGTVTVYSGKVEVGQNIRTSLAQAVAEELSAPIDSIRLVMADTDLTPYDMGTFGSRTTPVMAPQLRRAAAAARELLKELAGRKWGVLPSLLVMGGGKVTHPASRRVADFGALTRGRKLVRTLDDDVALKPSGQWTVAGTSVAKVGGRDIVTGRHRYTSDLVRAGAWFGAVLRPPVLGATLESVETAGTRTLPGVAVVRDGDFVGVAAAREIDARRALETLRPGWKTAPQLPGRQLYDHLRQARAPREGGRAAPAPQVEGSVAQGLAGAHLRHETTHTVAYIAHVPLEPRAAVAEWTDGRLTVWTGTQRPFGVRQELAEAFQLPEDKVRVIVPDTGSGYGGKHTGECAVEAARLAKGAGRPVKLVWTREEEFRWAYFRPAGVIDIRSGVDATGKLVAWETHNFNSGASAIRTPYRVPHQHAEFHPSDSPLPQGSYRGLAATANHFARECHMDELAAALAVDRLEFRLRNLEDPRLRAVLETAAARFGWSEAQARPPGLGHGIACGLEKGGYVATCAEVRVDGAGEVKVVRLVAAFECGKIVNPDQLRNQVEGSVVMGLGGALFEAVEFDEGQIANPRLSLYRVPRFSDVPELEVVLLDREDLPSAGAGETPIVAVAPAVAGAIFAAAGLRLRSLPLVPRGLPAAPTAPAGTPADPSSPVP